MRSHGYSESRLPRLKLLAARGWLAGLLSLDYVKLVAARLRQLR